MRIDGIEYRVEVRVADAAPEKLYVSATMKNITGQPIHLVFSDCALTLQVFDGLRRLRFDSSSGMESATGALRICLLYEAVKDLAPRESFTREEFQVVVPTYEILGHPLLGWTQPDGMYDLRAVIRMNPDANLEDPYTRMVVVPLGEVLLRTWEGATMPGSRVRGDVLYRTFGPSPGASTSRVEAYLIVTNRTDMPTHASVLRGCPVTLYGYMDRQKAHAAYLYAAAKPDWTWPSEPCAPEYESFALAPKEERRFPVEVDVSPALREGPPDSVVPGRYYFVASVPVPDDLPLLIWAGVANLGL
ncbi:MAG: hypothetical protein HY681_04950 [Chloroflexi bacterium]|nr:hypothetical protein [Chloroflexota bacterium]